LDDPWCFWFVYRENELVDTGRKQSASEKEQVYLFPLSKRASRRRAFNDSKNTLRIEEKKTTAPGSPFPTETRVSKVRGTEQRRIMKRVFSFKSKNANRLRKLSFDLIDLHGMIFLLDKKRDPEGLKILKCRVFAK